MLQNSKFRSFALIPACLFTCLAACGETPDSSAKEAICADASIIAADAWMRAVRPGQPTSAAYLTLTNCTDEEDKLVAITFEGAAAAAHQTQTDETGVVSMAHLSEIAIKPGESVRFEPGATHIMLTGLNRGFAPGDSPVLTLQFEKAMPVNVALDVRPIAPQ